MDTQCQVQPSDKQNLKISGLENLRKTLSAKVITERTSAKDEVLSIMTNHSGQNRLAGVVSNGLIRLHAI